MEALQVGLLKTGDSYPTVYAKEQGFFEREGLVVEFTDFNGAMQRDSAFQAGKLDAMHADLIGTSLLYQAQPNFQIVTLILGEDKKRNRGSALVGGKNAGLITIADLKGATVGISQNTIIEYMLDRHLRDAGIPVSAVKKIPIPDIALRLQMLKQGSVQAAFLPEPLASMAVADGGTVLSDDRGTFYSHMVLVFSKDALAKKRVEVEKFVRGFQHAMAALNANPQAFHAGILKRCNVPDTFAASLQYHYEENRLPSRQLFDDVQDWLVNTKRLKQPIAFESLNDGRFINAVKR